MPKQEPEIKLSSRNVIGHPRPTVKMFPLEPHL